MANKLFALVLVGVGGVLIVYARSQAKAQPIAATTPAGPVTINPADYTTTTNSQGQTVVTDNSGLGITIPTSATQNTVTDTSGDIADYTQGAVMLRVLTSDPLVQTIGFAVNVNGTEVYRSDWRYGDADYTWTGPANVIAVTTDGTTGQPFVIVYDSTGVNVLLAQNINVPGIF